MALFVAKGAQIKKKPGLAFRSFSLYYISKKPDYFVMKLDIKARL